MIQRYAIFLFLLFFPGIAFSGQDLKSAFKESSVVGNSRTYFFQRNYDIRNTRQDIATGGMFYYTSGDLHGVSLGITFYTGQGMGLNNNSRDVYGLLAKDSNGNHEDFTVVGESYIKAILGNTTLKLGRQELELPWINTDDNRLAPQSTNAYTITNNSIKDLDILFSHVTRMRGKASESFISMTRYADLPIDRSVSTLGITYKGIKDLEMQLWDFYGYDFINNLYMKSIYTQETEENWTWHIAGQYLKQTDVGDQLGGVTDSYMYALETGVSTNGFDISLTGSVVGNDDILYPWGHDFFVSAVINDLYQAKGKGVRAVLAYDFNKIGIPGLSAKAAYAYFNLPDSGVNAGPDLSETDLDLKYKFHGYFDGLGIRARYGIVNQDESLGGEDYGDMRVQMTYNFKF